MLLPVRRTEFIPQEFTPNFVLPLTHEMCIQPYLSYCLETNSYTFQSNASRLQAYLRGLVFKTRKFIPVILAQCIGFYSRNVSRYPCNSVPSFKKLQQMTNLTHNSFILQYFYYSPLRQNSRVISQPAHRTATYRE